LIFEQAEFLWTINYGLKGCAEKFFDLGRQLVRAFGHPFAANDLALLVNHEFGEIPLDIIPKRTRPILL